MKRMRRKERIGMCRSAMTAILLGGGIGILSAAATSADATGVDLEKTRNVLSKYVETRRQISKEKRDWALARQTLLDQIEVVASGVEAIRDKIGVAQRSIAETEKDREEQLKEKNRFETALAALEPVIAELETGTKELLQRLPETVNKELKPLTEQLPKTPEEAKKLTLATRFRNVLGILNVLNKKNTEIKVASERRTLPDGTSAEVTVMYVGLSHAYYVGLDEKVAAMETATQDGWVRKPMNEQAPQIRKAIKILRNEEPARYVKLPITLK